METLLQFKNMTAAMPLIFAGVLLLILIISFRSRAVVFCQYLETMTGIRLKPSDVRRVYREKGRNGVRELFLDLIIKEDLKEGPIDPEATLSRRADKSPSRRGAGLDDLTTRRLARLSRTKPSQPRITTVR